MICRKAPAKINLFLHVIGKRDDGYHELVTRMQKIDLCDTLYLELSRKPGVRFECDDPELPKDHNNLAVRAARDLLDHLGKSKEIGVAIRLEKRIPAGAGLGGGSSDSGTVLKAVNDLLGHPCSTGELIALAARIGADVPFFAIDTTSVLATGIGERMVAVPDLRGYWILLVNPGISIATGWVFQNLTLTKKIDGSKLKGSVGFGQEVFSLDQMHNDLEKPVCAHYPVIDEIRQALLEAGAERALMSGSGSTVYGLFADQDVGRKNDLIDRFTAVFGKRVYAARSWVGA